ncbi:glucosaminidase [Vibrio sp. T187]|uniref:glucosaminidase domain-containing protein n=1 Tax=Vibrio TaxID=662 RepID=UPI0010C9F723|nr:MULTISPECIES: glucosaminidase domain-containing protein [Vibrio]MBW3697870.1 glucosaminidase [Vibrio sp. T187]
MPKNDLTKAGARILAISAFGALSAVGPYLYESEERRQKKQVETETASEQVTSTPPKLPTSTPDFSAIKDTKQKKQAFFDYLRPSITIENNRILKERAFLNRLLETEEAWTSEQTLYAKRLGKLYSLPLPQNKIDSEWIQEMLARVNILPEALVLTQAANESAWGTSRFATEASNFFGHWCYTKGCGLVPLQRNEGSTHEVAKFKSSQESVHRYFMNVNRNRAYVDLRNIRSELMANNVDLTTPETATKLSNGLLKYSERGVDYVTDLQAMIRHNSSFWVQ